MDYPTATAFGAQQGNYPAQQIASIGHAVPQDTNAVQSLLTRLVNLGETLASAADRYQRVCDRAFGQNPEPANKGGSPIAGGMLDILGARLGEIEQQAKTLHLIADRIDTII